MSVTFSASEALAFINSWEPASDVYAFHYGHTILTASATLSAVFINFRFRRALKLRSFAFLSTYGATVLIPSVASAFLHGLVVVKPMLSKTVHCPVCLETRSSLVQVMCGVVYPVILAPMVCIPFADSYMTMAVPSLYHNPMLVFKQVINILRPLGKRLLIITAVQALIGGALAHWEFSNLFTVVEKVRTMEEVLARTVSAEEMERIRERASQADFDEMIVHERPKPKYFFSLD